MPVSGGKTASIAFVLASVRLPGQASTLHSLRNPHVFIDTAQVNTTNKYQQIRHQPTPGCRIIERNDHNSLSRPFEALDHALTIGPES